MPSPAVDARGELRRAVVVWSLLTALLVGTFLGTVASLKAFAAETVPVVEGHLDHALDRVLRRLQRHRVLLEERLRDLAHPRLQLRRGQRLVHQPLLGGLRTGQVLAHHGVVHGLAKGQQLGGHLRGSQHLR